MKAGEVHTMYRLLRQHGQLAHRRSEHAVQKRSKPRALVATGPNQVFCWDITYLPTQVRGQHFYLYLFEDLFSRKIVGYHVHDSLHTAQVSQALKMALRLRQSRQRLIHHSDRGIQGLGEWPTLRPASATS